MPGQYEIPCNEKENLPNGGWRFNRSVFSANEINFESFSRFLEKYLMNTEGPFSDLFGFWHKINRAWQASIKNSSLSLCVAIEGVVKKYFGEFGLPDKEILQQAEDAKKILKDIDLGQRIKGWLLSSVGGLLKNTSPKGALYQMAQNGLLNKSMVDVWVKLRNKSAHPNKMNQNSSAVQSQVYIDQIYTCIVLFYHLLFIIIEYDGNYIDYSQNGWPEKKFQLKEFA